MGQGSTAFLLGIVAAQQLPVLPSVFVATLPALTLPALALRLPILRLPGWFAAGFAWALFHAASLLATALPSALEGTDLVVEGTIATVPEVAGRITRFEFRVARLLQGDIPIERPPARIRLNWYDGAPPVAAGEHWRLTVRLKRPRGFANPGGFDYEGWLFRRGVRATGYVRGRAENRRIDGPPAYRLQRVRQEVGAAIATAVGDRPYGGIVVALATGDRQGIAASQWDTFRRTGTSHLVAISGLHIGLVAGLLYLVVRWGWAAAGAPALRWPAQQAGAVAALAGAGVYAALAGFSVPTRRALIMAAVVMAATLARRRRSLSRTLATALLFVLVVDPFAVMDYGFWLSFGAVAAILYAMSARIAPGPRWAGALRLHVAVTIGLAPTLVVLFQQLPLASPIANLVAVPWVSLGVVPLVLAGAALVVPFPAAGMALLQTAESLLALLWPFLDALAAPGWLQWTQHAPSPWTIAAAAAGTALILAPHGVPLRALGALWLLPALLAAPPRPAPGEVWFTLLDVGQGLSAVVRTRDHTLVYDAGARFGPDFDAGAAAVGPWLRSQGIERIDLLVISHADNDHIGGARSLTDAFTVGRILSGEPERVDWRAAEACAAGEAWRWDGVDFRVLGPAPGTGLRRNDASCVLHIEAGDSRILLTGDIEARAEAGLLGAGADLRAAIVVAPHHGSRTSSTPAFVAAVAPDLVLFPVGHRNRWGFPHPDVAGRYRAAGAAALDTAAHGAISVRIGADGTIDPPRAYRRDAPRYWREPAPRAPDIPGPGEIKYH